MKENLDKYNQMWFLVTDFKYHLSENIVRLNYMYVM